MKKMLFIMALAISCQAFIQKDTVMAGYKIRVVKTWADSQAVMLYSSSWAYVDTVTIIRYANSGIKRPTTASWKNYGSQSPSARIDAGDIWYDYSAYSDPAGYACRGVRCYATSGKDCYQFSEGDFRQSPAGASYTWVYDQAYPLVTFAAAFLAGIDPVKIIKKDAVAHHNINIARHADALGRTADKKMIKKFKIDLLFARR
jgi:hypothetical protein